MRLFAGIDVGGTKSAGVLVAGDGAIVARTWVEHGGRDAGRLLGIVGDSFEALLESGGVTAADVEAIGVAVSGLVSADGSTVVRAPTLGERGLPLGQRLADRLGLRVLIVNDANATLVGHARRAAAQDAAEPGVTLLLSLGTGFGGAVMVGDRLLTGEHGFAAELGHLTVDFDDQRICPCGSRGCVEQFASGRGLAELAAASQRPRSRALLDARGEAHPDPVQAILAAAAAGDAWSIAHLERCGAMLGRAIAMLCVILDPGRIVIGGSFGHAASDWLLPAATRELRERWPFAIERPFVELTLDTVGPFAAAIGAACLAEEEAAEEMA